MKNKGSIFLFIVLINCFVPASAQTDMYMKVMDPAQINGESTNSLFPNWINIYGYNAGSTTPVSIGGGAGGSGATGNTSTNVFTFAMCVDKSLYELKRQMYLGSPLQTVQIDFVRYNNTAASVYYRLQFENAFISKIEEAGTTADGRPLCNISLTPVKFRYTYWAPSTGGPAAATVVFGWDVAANVAW